MLNQVRRPKLTAGFGRGIKRRIGKSNFALLYPSKMPIFPIQTFITSLRDDDRLSLQKLGVKEVAAFYAKEDDERDSIDDSILKVIDEARQEVSELLAEEE